MVICEVARSISKLQVALALDVAAFLDVDALDFLAGRAGLLGDELHAEHLLGGREHLVDRLDHLDAAALAAAAGVDLRLDHPDRAAQLLRLGFRLRRGVGDVARAVRRRRTSPGSCFAWYS